MEKYNWSPNTIDELQAEKIIDLEFGDWKNKKVVEEIVPIDSIPGFG